MRCAVTFTLLLLGTLAGCHALGRRTQIPLGTWSGSGVFAVCDWERPSTRPDQSAPRLSQCPYTTSLRIEPLSDGPAGSVRIEILSYRGAVSPFAGDRTHLIAELVQAESLGIGPATLYEVRACRVSLDTAQRGTLDPPDNPHGGCCMHSDTGPVLHLQYFDNYVDTFHFLDDRVLKYGSYRVDQLFVHWSESLQRTP